MTAKCVVTNGRATSYLELEAANVGMVSDMRRTWRQLSFPKGRLVGAGLGTWGLREETTMVNDRFVVHDGTSLVLNDQNGRILFQFAREPDFSGRGDSVPGAVFWPDGSKEAVTLTPAPMQTRPERWWFGIGVKVGGTVAVKGCETLVGVVFNIALGAMAPLMIESSREGLGLGGSGGVVMIGAYGFKSAEEFVGLEVGGLDFSLSLGERWSSWVKSAKIANPHMLSAMKSAAALVPTSCRNVGSLKELTELASRFAQCEGAIGWAKNIVGLSAYTDHERAFATLDVPMLQKGLEIGLYNCSGKITAVSVSGVGGRHVQWAASEPEKPSPPMREPHYGGGNRSLY